MLYDILKYELDRRKKILETSNVAILINDMEETAISQIKQIAKEVKSLKIVTSKVNRFIYLEEKLYSDYGIGVQVTNNKEKALQSSEIIINIDFDEDMLKEYCIKDNATIINIKKTIKKIDNFNGVIINDYKIKYNEEMFKGIKKCSNFDKKVLYESLIYRRDNFYNIKKQLNSDGIELTELIRETN